MEHGLGREAVVRVELLHRRQDLDVVARGLEGGPEQGAVLDEDLVAAIDELSQELEVTGLRGEDARLLLLRDQDEQRDGELMVPAACEQGASQPADALLHRLGVGAVQLRQQRLQA